MLLLASPPPAVAAFFKTLFAHTSLLELLSNLTVFSSLAINNSSHLYTFDPFSFTSLSLLLSRVSCDIFPFVWLGVVTGLFLSFRSDAPRGI